MVWFMYPWHLGIDVGGTKIAFGAFKTRKDKKPFFFKTIPTPHKKHLFVKILIHEINLIAKHAPISIGIGIPGRIDKFSEMVMTVTNLPLVRFPLKKMMQKVFPKTIITVLNDVQAGVVGEWLLLGQKYNPFLGLFVGTGIGGGIIIDGKLFRGASGFAGEFGHMTIDPKGPLCGCGHYGCLEAFSSGKGLEHIGGIPLKELLHKKNKHTKFLISQMEKMLLLGLKNLFHAFNPQAILLGGGVPPHIPHLFSSLKKKLPSMLLSKFHPFLLLKSYSPYASVLGAAHAHDFC